MREVRPAFAPAVHQPFERRRGRRPVLARCERLGLLDQLLLGRPGFGLGVLQLGEVNPSGLVEGVASCAEALPEGGLGLPVELGTGPLQGLPLVEQRPHARAAGLPLDLGFRLTGDPLGLADELGTLGLARLAGSASYQYPRWPSSPRRRPRSHGSGHPMRPKITDDAGIGNLLAQLGEPFRTLSGGQVRVRHPLQEKISGGEQLVILAGEVAQCLGMAGARVWFRPPAHCRPCG